MTLRQARILSSEADSNITQTQTTNINVKVNPGQKQKPEGGISYSPSHPTNFTLPPATDPSLYPSVQPMSSISVTDPKINDPNTMQSLSEENTELTKRNRFLELLLAAYQQNPIRINSVIICNYRLLIEMIKLLTDADKVDLILDDEHVVNCSCCNDTDHDELLYIQRILITENNRTEDLKYGYNNIHSEFVKFGVSLKIVCR